MAGLSVDRVGALAHLPAPKNVGAGAAFGRLYAVEDSALRVLDLDGLLRREFVRVPAERRAAERLEAGAIASIGALTA